MKYDAVEPAVLGPRTWQLSSSTSSHGGWSAEATERALHALFEPFLTENDTYDPTAALARIELRNARPLSDLSSLSNLPGEGSGLPTLTWSGASVDEWHGMTSQPIPRVRQDVLAALAELDELSVYSDGWKGGDSRGASPEATRQAEKMLRALARVRGLRSMPMVGLDEDGFYCLTWNEDGLVGSLSVRGNGLYSFAIRRGQESFFSLKDRIDDGPSDVLIKALTSTN